MIFPRYVKRPVHRMKHTLSIVLFSSAVLTSGSVWAQLPGTQQYGNVEYVTGGFGSEESSAMKEAMSDYPLALTFSARNGGRSAYVSQVQVVVRDQYDSTVLNVESQGPFLLARLQPGSYQIHVTYRNATQSRPLTIEDRKSTRMVFEWSRPDAAADEHATESGATAQPEFAPGSIPGLD